MLDLESTFERLMNLLALSPSSRCLDVKIDEWGSSLTRFHNMIYAVGTTFYTLTVRPDCHRVDVCI